ncbi:related to NADH dehydrogenase 17.8K chain [Rhynchosporium secalis]|uniref:Related to NADH dehydrogenase 17.8K chain n=1 Tax=Rhynchosporium secalis TaxID=38038 RepID=A0A1E1M951_RHYSE|nr:related to NADH dehydrogenase 17.8K chain [Rhynchosporium secalis]
MFALRRKAVESAGRLPAAAGRRTSPYSTAHPEKHGDQGHHHEGPKAESLGTQFYVALVMVPLSLGVYAVSRPSANGQPAALTNYISSTYNEYKDTWAARNTLHTAALESAAFDRNLFQSTPGSRHIELRFPEIFNTGSPHNVVAGQGARNMDQLVAHYEKKNADMEEKKVKALAARAAESK